MLDRWARGPAFERVSSLLGILAVGLESMLDGFDSQGV